jgi:hypothetical protein
MVPVPPCSYNYTTYISYTTCTTTSTALFTAPSSTDPATDPVIYRTVHDSIERSS